MNQHPDCLLAIEVGYKVKFYGDHAEIASRILNLGCYPDRNFISLWIPLSRLAHHVRRLVEAGYKVGVVRQTETAALKKVGDNKNQPFKREVQEMYTRATIEAGGLAALESNKKSGEHDDIDNNADHGGESAAKAQDDEQGFEVNNTITPSTTTTTRQQQPWSNERLSRHLVVLVEPPPPPPPQLQLLSLSGKVCIGLIAIEVSTSTTLYAEFNDGPMREQLEKYLLMTPPSEVVLGGDISSSTRRLIDHFVSGGSSSSSGGGGGGGVTTTWKKKRGGVGSTPPPPLTTTTQSSYSSTVSTIAAPSDGDVVLNPENWPPFQYKLLADLPPMVLRAVLCGRKYLEPLGLESALIFGKYQCYSSLHTEIGLLPNALVQLEILKTNCPSSGGGEKSSSSKGGGGGAAEKGSLLWLLDRTLTPGGGRLMREWVTKPLRDRMDIEERLTSVEEIMTDMASNGVLAALPGVLKSLPDLSRIIGRAFHGTCAPSEFVIMLQTFSSLPLQLKLVPTEDGNGDLTIQEGAARCLPLMTLLKAAGSFMGAAAARELLACLNVRAAAAGDKLNMFITPPSDTSGGDYIDEDMKDAEADDFEAEDEDIGAAFKSGGNNNNDDDDADANKIYYFPEVEEKKQAVRNTKKALLDLLPGYASKLKLKNLTYVSIQNQGDYMVEVPVDLASRVPKDWERVCSTKKVVRYRPPEVKEWMGELGIAEEQLTLACNAAWRSFQRKFSQGRSHWLFTEAIAALSQLDCLLSLANLASSQPGYVRPEFITTKTDVGECDKDPEDAELHIVGGRHPVLEMMMQGSHQYVPNNISLSTVRNKEEEEDDGSSSRCMLITGPNMGGKSSISRSVALIVLMAQIGSFVPATSCRMTCFDGVFTRFGASDNIALGRSTFMEELSEMGGILSKATKKSLVLVDELGRGTATQDGQAIAAATLQYLADTIGCLTLFITHYNEVAQNGHKLSRDEGAVRAWHMGYVEEKNKSDREEDGREDGLPHISFTYKIKPGAAPASYGLNVARLAGVPTMVLRRADEVSSLQALQEAVTKVKRMVQ
jgi:DNA mismatch repair protein MSH3